jgi:hypothetical protein
MVRCKNAGGGPSDGDLSPPRVTEVARGKRKKIAVKKRKRTPTEAEIAQAVADATEHAERGGRGNGIHISERRSGRTHAQVIPRLEGQRCAGHPPPRARGHPLVEHFNLRGATARQVQSLRFVEVSWWFPPQRDARASEGFYTPLREDFYRAYVDSRIAFRPQRVCRLEALVEVVGEKLRPHLSFLPGLSDFLGRTGAYSGTWVREFYSSLWIDPTHEFIHFAFRGRDRRLYSTRVWEILRLPSLETKIHQLCFG